MKAVGDLRLDMSGADSVTSRRRPNLSQVKKQGVEIWYLEIEGREEGMLV